ncbi:putative acyl-CoA transferase/carnitine dehydratase [Mycolicibacterium rhodesiae NBB3]|uniref:Putative acyl-CoA transferase/carnitine dehydratase n=1 Tax=Mycolicibacterium rhodesiae (strain NBB3) TaxID=710685 RepID=G8RSP3_MYCRN|nr:CoA transferase [Mycolicibacterium rhodesiae]AEV76576.1 putative acyl-CoA transferase/carnitine dehydratase [Mycolicibacterium rhodesiae NBB3]
MRAEHLPFDGLRVVELSSGIAPGYCGKMFVDAGATVVKVESAEGDPMRSWRARADSRPGALFSFLAAGKKSVAHGESNAEVMSLLAGADVVITGRDGRWDPSEIAAAVPTSAVVVVISPFGDSGPYVDIGLSANEFLLQAMCGSIGGRGWPESEPVQAGGRLGEWFAGSFAAVAAAASVRRARRTGAGETIDLSVYEAMAIAMGSLGAVSASVLGGDAFGTRSLELPSIVPTADGLVGFCTITAQQFQDFLVLIERADLLDDEELATMPGRIARREEFLTMVHDWAADKTTAEIVDSAAAFRIPVSPIATPTTITSIDHYAVRGVFVEAADGARAPRVPYRSPSIPVRPPGAAPAIGADNGRVHWPAAVAAEPAQSPPRLPLAGVRIVDLTAFWAGPMATQVLAALGADVIKVEGVRRPDGMRFAGGRPPSWDRWWEWGPVFQCSNTNKRGITLELSTARGRETALDLIARSDIVIENFSPRVLANFDLEWDVVHSVAPQVTMMRMPAFGLDGPWRDRVGFAQTMEQASGMAWMTGSSEGAPIIPRGLCDPLAGLHASFAAIAALEIRDRTGAGIHVESTMVEAALNVAAEPVLEYTRNGVELRREGNRGPGASPQGVYRCKGDDQWVALAVFDERTWLALAEVIGHSELAVDDTLCDEWARRGRADEIDKLIEGWTSQENPEDVVATLRAHRIPAASVVGAADLLEDEHLTARGFWETVEHPVIGTFKTTGMPFTYAGGQRKWVTTPAPLYGQHTDEVLRDVLGCTPADIASLEEVGAVARRPAGL